MKNCEGKRVQGGRVKWCKSTRVQKQDNRFKDVMLQEIRVEGHTKVGARMKGHKGEKGTGPDVDLIFQSLDLDLIF